MKIFSWMRNKLTGNDNINKKPDPKPTSQYQNQPCNEELNDWPNALLAIGTFGNSKTKESDKCQGNLPAKQDAQETATAEELAEADKVLRQLIFKHMSDDSTLSGESEKNDLLLDKLLDSLPKYAKNNDELINDDVPRNKAAIFQRSTSLVCRGEGNEIRVEKNSGISKKSLTFLLKKVFLCSGGFVPTPALREPLPFPDQRLEKSRMEKILRAMLHKKIYPQRPTPKAASTKYLDMLDSDSDDEENRDSKWVKTDSEYIVLEI